MQGGLPVTFNKRCDTGQRKHWRGLQHPPVDSAGARLVGDRQTEGFAGERME